SSRSHVFLDDDRLTYKHLPHGGYEITMRDGRVIMHDDPGDTIQIDPSGTVTHIPNSSSRMADLQNFQQAALATLSQGPQGAAAGGSSTDTFNVPLQLLPINFTRPDNGAVQSQIALNIAATTSGFVEVVQVKAPTPLQPVLTTDALEHSIIEVPHTTGSATPDIAPTATLTFNQLNLIAVSASLASTTWRGGTTVPGGLAAELAGALSVTGGSVGPTLSGSIAATFSAPDKDFDFLAANETLTVVYNVTATDTNGVSVTQPVTITITGSNDPPVLAADPFQVHPVAEGLATTGTLTFTDVDLTDHHTVTTSVASATWSGGTTLPSGLATVLAGALSTTTADSTGSGSGSIALTFSAADPAFDFLAAGQTLKVTYNVTVTDEAGASSTQPVTITITGTNDAPVVSTTSNAFTELAGTNNATPDTVSGAISFTDVDLTDRPLANAVFNSYTYTDAVHNPLTLTPAQLAAVAVPVSVAQAAGNTNNGSASWTYSLADSKFDFLAAGETLTLIYTATVDDGHGGVVSQPFTVIITGTNDAPVITSGVQSGLVTEIADGAAGENTAPHSLSGAVTFTDVDLSDIETSSISNTQVVAPLANGYTLSAAQQSALVNAFTIDAATHSTTDGSGSIGWHYNINDSALDFLGKNDQVVLTFTVQVADGNGGFNSQDVTITVVGAEDVPVITSAVQSGSVAHGTTTTHSLSGAVTFTDVDLSDIETSAISNKQVVATLANGAT